MTQPRAAAPTIGFIDRYCSQYQTIFPEVRSYEAFKRMLLGIITPSPRKSLTTIGEIVGLKNSQSLHNFITESPWSYQQLRAKWRKFTRIFAAHPPETRYVREVIFGRRGHYTYWDLTTEPETLPPHSTSYVMTNIPNIKYS
jgi:SRSO17 transposase